MGMGMLLLCRDNEIAIHDVSGHREHRLLAMTTPLENHNPPSIPQELHHYLSSLLESLGGGFVIVRYRSNTHKCPDCTFAAIQGLGAKYST